MEEKVMKVAQRLTSALEGLLCAVPKQPHRPVDLSKALGIHRDLSRKILVALRNRDPLVATAALPGPEGLHQIVKAATRKKIDPQAVANATGAIDEYGDFIRKVVGGRSELDAMISAWVPEARERFELTSKQMAYKGIANLIGVRADLVLGSLQVIPSKSGKETFDYGAIIGLTGVRRLRPGAPIHRTHISSGPPAGDNVHVTFDGEPVDESSANTYLTEFSSSPTPRLTVKQSDRIVRYIVESDDVGLDSAVDLFFGEVLCDALFRYTSPDNPRRSAIGAFAEVPSRVLVFDALMHKDVWPEQDPELVVYDTTLHGMANPNDASRDMDKLDIREHIRFLGWGVSQCRLAEVQRYVEMLRFACAKLGFPPEEFRCYRCRIDYPVYGSQVSMVFKRPFGPGA